MASLKQQTISGMIWSGVQRFGTMGISFISNMVLARLLTPDDFGCIGMLAIFIALSNTFIDGGFGSALIQKKEPTQKDYSTIFYWNIILGVILYLILYLSSPYIASFYDIPLLEKVLKIQGLVLIINAFSIIQSNQLRKKILFKRLAFVNVVATTISVIIAIVMAYNSMGIWSLVVQQLSFSFFSTVFLWIIGKWHPSLVFSLSSFKELFSFGSFMLLSSFVNTLFNNINGLIIGKLFSPSTMGYFSQAKKVEDVSALSITHVIEQVTYPLLAEYQNDAKNLRVILSKVNATLLYIIAPLMLIVNLLSEQIIVFLFSDKWLPSAPYLQILAIQGIMITLQGVNYNALAAIGKSKTLFTSTIIKRFSSILFMIIGVVVGDVIGLLWGMTFSSCFIALYNMLLVAKYLDFSLANQLKPLLPIMTISIIAFLACLLLKSVLELQLMLNGIIIGLTFILVYVLLTLCFKIPYLSIILTAIRSKILKR